MIVNVLSFSVADAKSKLGLVFDTRLAIPTLLPLWSVPAISIESPILILVLSKFENKLLIVAAIPFTVLNAEPCSIKLDCVNILLPGIFTAIS